VKVAIEGLAFEAIIGILESERAAPQKVVVDAEFEYPYEPGRYLDYALARKLIITHIQKNRFGLLEDALHSLAQLLKERFPFICALQICISKPQIFADCTPKVTLTRRFC